MDTLEHGESGGGAHLAEALDLARADAPARGDAEARRRRVVDGPVESEAVDAVPQARHPRDLADLLGRLARAGIDRELRVLGPGTAHQPSGRPAQPEREGDGRGCRDEGTAPVLCLPDVQVREAGLDVAGGAGAELLRAGAGDLLDHDCSSVVPSRVASSARARDRWTLTVPSAQPSVAATSMT